MATSALGTPVTTINGTSTTLSSAATGPSYRGVARAGTQVVLRGKNSPDLTVLLEGCETNSTDDADWYPIDPLATGGTVFTGTDETNYILVDEPHHYLRARVTAHVAGDVTAIYVPFYGAR